MMGFVHGRIVYGGIVYARGEGDVFRLMRQLESLQRLPPSELRSRQDERLHETLSYALQRCEYYRTHWPREVTEALAADAGPHAVRALLQQLPMIAKPELQANAASLTAYPGPARVTRKTTGGSTGQAVTVVKDRHATAAEMAATWLGYGWFGIRVGDRAARFWGAPTTVKRRLRFAAADLAMNRIRFSAFAFTEADLERYWRACLKFRPAYFYGYVSMLEAFAQFVADRGYDGARLGLKAIVTTSEVLTPPQRRVLTETFGVPVQNEYGCGEVGPIAYECPEGSLHVMSENVLVEVVDESGRQVPPGAAGEIVVTDLNNRAMPLVRYRLGDNAVAGGDCRCGRGFPVLEKVWGRAYDFVQGPDGRRYHGEFFMYLFEDLRERGCPVGQFQVNQLGARELEILVVPSPGGPGDLEPRLLRAFAERLPAFTARIRRVTEIPRAPSGKMRIIQNAAPATAGSA